MDQVQVEFLYARTNPVGPYPLLEPDPFNKWFFYAHPNLPRRAPLSIPNLGPICGPNCGPIKKIELKPIPWPKNKNSFLPKFKPYNV